MICGGESAERRHMHANPTAMSSSASSSHLPDPSLSSTPLDSALSVAGAHSSPGDTHVLLSEASLRSVLYPLHLSPAQPHSISTPLLTEQGIHSLQQVFTAYLLHPRPVRHWLVSSLVIHSWKSGMELMSAGLCTAPGDGSYCGIQEGQGLP